MAFEVIQKVDPRVIVESVSEVKVNIAVTTLGPLQDDKEILVVTCYLRSVSIRQMRN